MVGLRASGCSWRKPLLEAASGLGAPPVPASSLGPLAVIPKRVVAGGTAVKGMMVARSWSGLLSLRPPGSSSHPTPLSAGPEYQKRKLLQEIVENAEHAVNMEEEALRPEGAPPPPTPPESPQLHEQDEARRRASPAPSPAATPPEAKRAKAAPHHDGALRPGSWAEAAGRPGGGSPVPPEGEGRPASRGWGHPAEQMEIGPLQRMAREPDVELFKGYHGYAIRTSPVSPAADYEEEPLPEPEAPSPEPRGGTPAPPQEREEKPAARAEAKPEPPRPKELKQRSSPEHRAAGRGEPAADRKTEARAPGRTEPKAGAKRSPAPAVAPAPAAAVAAAQEAEECEEVTWGQAGRHPWQPSLPFIFGLLFARRSGPGAQGDAEP